MSVDLTIILLRGLHLTGVAQVSGPPRPLGWRPLQARRMPAFRWRGRGDLPWPLAGDDVAGTHPIVAYGEFQQPGEDQPAASRAASVEAGTQLLPVALHI